jgi:hypothetical protein
MSAAEATIKGEFNLTAKEQTISSRKASIFLRKQYDPGNPGYEFRIVTPSRLKDGEVLPFFLDPGNGKDATRYDLAVRPEFYEREVEISYHSGLSNLFAAAPGEFEVAAGSQRETLAPQVAVGEIWDAPRSFLEGLLRIPEVHAQANTPIEALIKDLDSPDPIIRREARSAMSIRQQSALPAIESVLANRGTSYLSTLGCIVALSGMKGADLGNLGPDAYAGITNAANSGDNDLMTWVKKLAEQHPELRSKIAADPFVGVWRLNLTKSRLEASLSGLIEENRRILKVDTNVEVTIKRLHKGEKSPESVTYQFSCDGKRYRTGGQTLTCVSRTSTVLEGEQSPPQRFYRREVSPDGRTMTISVFGTQTRDNPISVEFFERL